MRLLLCVLMGALAFVLSLAACEVASSGPVVNAPEDPPAHSDAVIVTLEGADFAVLFPSEDRAFQFCMISELRCLKMIRVGEGKR